jgi:hypothetical protein
MLTVIGTDQDVTLTRSTDGQYLIAAGLEAQAYSPIATTNPNTALNSVVGRVSYNAKVNTTLRIAYQARPRLFDRCIVLPELLYERVVEADERVGAHGELLQPLDEPALRGQLQAAFDAGFVGAHAISQAMLFNSHPTGKMIADERLTERQVQLHRPGNTGGGRHQCPTGKGPPGPRLRYGRRFGVDENPDAGSVQVSLVDGLRCSDAPQFGRTIGGEYQHGHPIKISFDNGGMELHSGGTACREYDYWAFRCPGETERHERT